MTEPSLESQLSGIRGLVLDVDDTILDTRSAMTTAGVPAAAALWPGHSHAHHAMSTRYYDDPGGWFNRYAAGELSIEAMRLARLQDVATSFGVVLPDDAETAYLAAYVPAFRRSQRLFDDVPSLLARTAAVGLPIVLLTNSTDLDTAIKLEALGIRERFVGVVTTDTLGVGKPDPRVYHEACRLLGVDAALTVCIGDSLEWDVLGAMRAGLRAVWLDRAGAGPVAGDPAVARVTDLHAVSSRLGRSTSRRFGARTVDR